ncbi:hypothetical protein [Enterococcus wangshanyuanii]|uniref:Uncharacterized protein n=1 Tax=Enterococcus wangshanyuanii TaxID=2005703 RepID=A0ABQ1P6Z3_9ENTE|nr:hypothetical protein [Enterococcus wangshanyuanii]GGC92049.1 hypothetical protein GCM10011573_22030 [Enterococcus wangshanyuanii]
MIELNEAEAQKQATQIGLANDRLSLSKTVTFSSGQTAVAAFKRADQQAKQLFTRRP